MNEKLIHELITFVEECKEKAKSNQDKATFQAILVGLHCALNLENEFVLKVMKKYIGEIAKDIKK